eukprot:4105962-Ditylum_brightwellii.AAC.1
MRNAPKHHHATAIIGAIVLLLIISMMIPLTTATDDSTSRAHSLQNFWLMPRYLNDGKENYDTRVDTYSFP